jgi:probable rRNA maturation factor
VIQISLGNQQSHLLANEDRIQTVVRSILLEAGVTTAEISIAVVDDPTIHDLNRRFLEHDYATDVLSFVLDSDDQRLEGEVIVSADTAWRRASEFDWDGEDELLLYVVHGTLHLVGFDDHDSCSRQQMREAERRHLLAFGIEPRYDEEADPASAESSPEETTSVQEGTGPK